MGASRVVGIDNNEKWLERARTRSPEKIEFLNGTWWDLPNEKFDVIFFLSSIHYESEQKRLLNELARQLVPGGTLVLECGVVQEAGSYHWTSIKRGIGDTRRYPTQDLLIDGLLEGWATRFVGPSVAQAGDPVKRFVYHCTPKSSVAILVGADPLKGKTAVSRKLGQKGTPCFSTDAFLMRAMRDRDVLGPDIHAALSKRFPDRPYDLGLIGNYLKDNCREDAISALIRALPLELNEFIVEGHLLSSAAMMNEVAEMLEARGVKAWRMTR